MSETVYKLRNNGRYRQSLRLFGFRIISANLIVGRLPVCPCCVSVLLVLFFVECDLTALVTGTSGSVTTVSSDFSISRW